MNLIALSRRCAIARQSLSGSPLALTAGGTIPDAGLLDVYVTETDLKVGTLDEEFVTESLPGDVFLLGSHAWKIAKVKAGRVLVEDAQGMAPTIPFWKGEHPSRSFDLGVAVGRLRRDAADKLDDPDFEAWATAEAGLDARAVRAMHAWLVKAGEVLQGVPDDQGIVVESFSDEMGGRHAMIHSVFGMRINGAWGMALREQVRRRFGLLVEASHVDDGILLSFAPGQVPPAPERLVTLVGPDELDPLLGEALIGSPMFATRFRHAAVRALFIPRMTRGQRTPAYLQRLKADALLESVRGQPDFPVVAETLRECFHDAYDVPRLKRLLERLQDGELWTRHVDTPLPSPFVYPLLMAWDWAYLDAGHAEERRSDAIVMRKAWSVAPGPMRADIVAAVEAELQKTTPERRARDANELAAILDDLGDLTARGDRRARARGGRRADRRPGGRAADRRGRVRRRAAHVDPGHRRHALRGPGDRGRAGASHPARAPHPGPDVGRGAGRPLRPRRRRGHPRARSPGSRAAWCARARSSRAPRAGSTCTSPCWTRSSAARCTPGASRGRWSAPSSSRPSCCAAITCTPSIAWSVLPASSPRSSCCRARTSPRASGSRTCSRRGSTATSASGSTGSASRARSCGRCSSRAAATAAARDAWGPRCARTSAGCARATERPPLDPAVKNVLLHLQLRGASFARDLGRATGLDGSQVAGRAVGAVPGGPGHARHLQRDRRRQHGAPRDRRAGPAPGGARAAARPGARSPTCRRSGAGARWPRRSRCRPRIATRPGPTCSWPATAWWRASWRAATGPRCATRCCAWSTAARSCAATSSRGSPASSTRSRTRWPS